jgi:hypothetical protein
MGGTFSILQCYADDSNHWDTLPNCRNHDKIIASTSEDSPTSSLNEFHGGDIGLSCQVPNSHYLGYGPASKSSSYSSDSLPQEDKMMHLEIVLAESIDDSELTEISPNQRPQTAGAQSKSVFTEWVKSPSSRALRKQPQFDDSSNKPRRLVEHINLDHLRVRTDPSSTEGEREKTFLYTDSLLCDIIKGGCIADLMYEIRKTNVMVNEIRVRYDSNDDAMEGNGSEDGLLGIEGGVGEGEEERGEAHQGGRREMNLLHLAVLYDRLDLARFLTQAGVNVSDKDTHGHTALFYAYQRCHVNAGNSRMIEFLAEAKAAQMHFEEPESPYARSSRQSFGSPSSQSTMMTATSAVQARRHRSRTFPSPCSFIQPLSPQTDEQRYASINTTSSTLHRLGILELHSHNSDGVDTDGDTGEDQWRNTNDYTGTHAPYPSYPTYAYYAHGTGGSTAPPHIEGSQHSENTSLNYDYIYGAEAKARDTRSTTFRFSTTNSNDTPKSSVNGSGSGIGAGDDDYDGITTGEGCSSGRDNLRRWVRLQQLRGRGRSNTAAHSASSTASTLNLQVPTVPLPMSRAVVGSGGRHDESVPLQRNPLRRLDRPPQGGIPPLDARQRSASTIARANGSLHPTTHPSVNTDMHSHFNGTPCNTPNSPMSPLIHSHFNGTPCNTPSSLIHSPLHPGLNNTHTALSSGCTGSVSQAHWTWLNGGIGSCMGGDQFDPATQPHDPHTQCREDGCYSTEHHRDGRYQSLTGGEKRFATQLQSKLVIQRFLADSAPSHRPSGPPSVASTAASTPLPVHAEDEGSSPPLSVLSTKTQKPVGKRLKKAAGKFWSKVTGQTS